MYEALPELWPNWPAGRLFWTCSVLIPSPGRACSLAQSLTIKSHNLEMRERRLWRRGPRAVAGSCGTLYCQVLGKSVQDIGGNIHKRQTCSRALQSREYIADPLMLGSETAAHCNLSHRTPRVTGILLPWGFHWCQWHESTINATAYV